MMEHRPPDLDLADDHLLWFVGWKPDRDLNPQYADLPDVERYGAILEHKKPDGSPCGGSLTFASDVAKRLSPYPLWTVESWEPLTISPSVLCACGDHGFIREGKWVRA